VVSQDVKREVYKKQAEEFEEKVPVYITSERKNTPAYLKYAAIFLLGISVLGIGNRLYNNYRGKQIIATAEQNQKEVEQKIENATFVISKPLPTINLEITTTPHTTNKSYHVIAGAFRFPENAEKKLRQLEKDGYNPRILGVNKWGLTIVTFDSYDNKRDAINSLNRIKRKKDKKAWLLVQDF
jgi:cell division protein FtsN